MNGELESVWMEVSVTSKETEENHQNPQYIRSRRRGLKPRFSEYGVQSATTSGAALFLLSVVNDMKKSALKYTSFINLQPGYC
jgi:hypothetical protein